MGWGQSKRSEGACDREREGYGPIEDLTSTCGRSYRQWLRNPPLSPPPSSLPLPFLQPAWFLMVGGDRSFKLTLTENDEEFSDELREDCEVRGDGEKGKGDGMEGCE